MGRGRVLAGLVGRGILESRTPWMHEQEAEAQNLRLIYSLFDFTDRRWSDEDLPRLLDAAQRVGFAGLNVTFPFKQAIIPLLDDLSTGARAVGAVNTVAFRDGKRIGYNTDVTGFAEGFRAGLADAPRSAVLQLGCGGAGSATAHALLSSLDAGRLILSDTDHARAEALRAQLAEAYGADRVTLSSDAVASAREADGIVNATPMGMDKFPGLPIAAQAIEPRHWIADIVYFPLVTGFLAEARRKGCQTLDGSGMAVGQAADAFEIFTGKTADRRRMRASFAAFVSDGPRAAA
ncbi:MAG: shikimate dehydrogenase [Sphingomonadales bacterium]|nr:shikimate dehydrogenase [Sphingomonadales bacterium]